MVFSRIFAEELLVYEPGNDRDKSLVHIENLLEEIITGSVTRYSHLGNYLLLVPNLSISRRCRFDLNDNRRVYRYHPTNITLIDGRGPSPPGNSWKDLKVLQKRTTWTKEMGSANHQCWEFRMQMKGWRLLVPLDHAGFTPYFPSTVFRSLCELCRTLRHAVQQGGLRLLIDGAFVGEEIEDEGGEEENNCFERRFVSLCETRRGIWGRCHSGYICVMGKGV